MYVMMIDQCVVHMIVVLVIVCFHAHFRLGQLNLIVNLNGNDAVFRILLSV